MATAGQIAESKRRAAEKRAERESKRAESPITPTGGSPTGLKVIAQPVLITPTTRSGVPRGSTRVGSPSGRELSPQEEKERLPDVALAREKQISVSEARRQMQQDPRQREILRQAEQRKIFEERARISAEAERRSKALSRPELTEAEDVQFIPGRGFISKKARDIIGTERLVQEGRERARKRTPEQEAALDGGVRQERFMERLNVAASTGALEQEIAAGLAGRVSNIPNVLSTQGFQAVKVETTPSGKVVTFEKRGIEVTGKIPATIDVGTKTVFVQAGKGFPTEQKKIIVDIATEEGIRSEEFTIKQVSLFDVRQKGEVQDISVTKTVGGQQISVDVSKEEIILQKEIKRIDGKPKIVQVASGVKSQFLDLETLKKTTMASFGEATTEEAKRAAGMERVSRGQNVADRKISEVIKKEFLAIPKSPIVNTALISAAAGTITVGALKFAGRVAPALTRAGLAASIVPVTESIVRPIKEDIASGKKGEAAVTTGLTVLGLAGFASGARAGVIKKLDVAGKKAQQKLAEATRTEATVQVISRKPLPSGGELTRTLDIVTFKPTIDSRSTALVERLTLTEPKGSPSGLSSRTIGMGRVITKEPLESPRVESLLDIGVTKASKISKEAELVSGLTQVGEQKFVTTGIGRQKGTLVLEGTAEPKTRVTEATLESQTVRMGIEGIGVKEFDFGLGRPRVKTAQEFVLEAPSAARKASFTDISVISGERVIGEIPVGVLKQRKGLKETTKLIKLEDAGKIEPSEPSGTSTLRSRTGDILTKTRKGQVGLSDLERGVGTRTEVLEKVQLARLSQAVVRTQPKETVLKAIPKTPKIGEKEEQRIGQDISRIVSEKQEKLLGTGSLGRLGGQRATKEELKPIQTISPISTQGQRSIQQPRQAIVPGLSQVQSLRTSFKIGRTSTGIPRKPFVPLTTIITLPKFDLDFDRRPRTEKVTKTKKKPQRTPSLGAVFFGLKAPKGFKEPKVFTGLEERLLKI